MSGAPFRSGRAGAKARREKLLAQARAQAAIQPLALRTIYVRRASQRATGAALAALGFAVAAASLSPALSTVVASLIPGDAPAPLTTLLLIAPVVGLQVYFVARALAESMFTRVMRASVMPSNDLYGDIERLRHLSAADVAARMARGIERGATVAPLVALAMLGPAFFAYGAAMLSARAVFPDPGIIDAALASSAAPRTWASLSLIVLAQFLAHRARLPPSQRDDGWGAIAACAAGSVLMLCIVPQATPWFGICAIAMLSLGYARTQDLDTDRAAISRALSELDEPDAPPPGTRFAPPDSDG